MAPGAQKRIKNSNYNNSCNSITSSYCNIEGPAIKFDLGPHLALDA